MTLMENRKKKDETVCPDSAEAHYVHVPFCRAKCAYCDFYSIVFDEQVTRRYIQAMRMELAACGEALSPAMTCAYVGGGTPTVLGAELLAELLGVLGGRVEKLKEFSVEANPGTVDEAVAEVLAAAGVNRVTLGVQSFQDAELRTLGRAHGPADVGKSAAILHTAGIDNLGIDLIYGIPGQTARTWADSLARGLQLPIEHLSCYALSFEAGTPLGRALQEGKVKEMDEALQEELYFSAIELAESHGLEQYEISNFARPTRRCLQNMTYWQNRPYLGLGPGAASYLGGVRRTNRPDLAGYLRCVLSGEAAPADSEKLVGRRAMAETLILALRLTEGVERAPFARRFEADPWAAFPDSIGRHLRLKSLEMTETHIRIARGRLFVSDSILADILAEA